ncbi:MAG: sugar ABC transporter ATP-binding protein [Pirellulaceae bacterium]|nr:sugar ABC transporter ATP-binding protein [Pirellulaceae bacterium]
MIQQPATIDDSPLLHIHQISKSYAGVKALQNVSLTLQRGEVHALCGENGAGKSTLIKILTGVVTADSGSIQINDRILPLGDVRVSESEGIAVMHQESTAFPDLNAIDNIFVGRELRKCGGMLLNRREMRLEANQLLQQLGETIDLAVPVGKLRLAQRQMVAMARAMSCQCQLFIMDEPTASLSAQETEVMLNLIAQLRDQGVTIMYVSHRLEEVYQIANRVTVLRDGETVTTQPIEDIDEQQLIRFMVGREAEDLTQYHSQAADHRHAGDEALRVVNLSRGSAFQSISLTVASGEIVGLAGLVGSGRTELARAIFGIDVPDSGYALVGGKRLKPASVRDSMRMGIAMVPEDRQHEGLILPMSIADNLSLANLNELRRFGFIQRSEERQLVEQQITDLGIKVATPGSAAESLSGGNQQKVVLGKWLATNPQVLILDEPTRGIDVAAKAQVHRLIRSLSAAGMATLLISSELTELLNVSDRILVMHEGALAAEFDGPTATQEQLLQSALLGTKNQPG